MTDYQLYARSCDIIQADMVKAIQKKYPQFSKRQMSLACNPTRNALQLIPAAEELLVEEFGVGPGLSISAKAEKKASWHQVRNKPNQLCVRLNDELFSQMQELVNRMGFQSNQDFLEACVAEFIQRHRRAA